MAFKFITPDYYVWGGATPICHADSPHRRSHVTLWSREALTPGELRDDIVLVRILSARDFWAAAAAMSCTCAVKRANELRIAVLLAAV